MLTQTRRIAGNCFVKTGGFKGILLGAGITALAALAGCGGGGNGFNPVTPAAPTPLPAIAALKLVTLVSDQPVAGAQVDPKLSNAWGIAFSSFSTIWVAANHSGFTTVYNGTGHTVLPPITIAPVPGASGPAAPTG